ncbi:MAG TPA: hypothetical protein VGY54_28070 [Polyangiaceae bacterium]|jgi:hypothetical protein|nr:hypothetical protein [Polyangiaceae bacterium]
MMPIHLDEIEAITIIAMAAMTRIDHDAGAICLSGKPGTVI